MITEGFPGCGLWLNVAANLSSLFFLTVPLTVAEPRFFSEYDVAALTTKTPPTFPLKLFVLLREVDVVVDCNLNDKEEEEEEEEEEEVKEDARCLKALLLLLVVVAQLKSVALIVFYFRISTHYSIKSEEDVCFGL